LLNLANCEYHNHLNCEGSSRLHHHEMNVAMLIVSAALVMGSASAKLLFIRQAMTWSECLAKGSSLDKQKYPNAQPAKISHNQLPALMRHISKLVQDAEEPTKRMWIGGYVGADLQGVATSLGAFEDDIQYPLMEIYAAEKNPRRFYCLYESADSVPTTGDQSSSLTNAPSLHNASSSAHLSAKAATMAAPSRSLGPSQQQPQAKGTSKTVRFQQSSSSFSGTKSAKQGRGEFKTRVAPRPGDYDKEEEEDAFEDEHDEDGPELEQRRRPNQSRNRPSATTTVRQARKPAVVPGQTRRRRPNQDD
jgi:hypothetical protein